MLSFFILLLQSIYLFDVCATIYYPYNLATQQTPPNLGQITLNPIALL